MSIAALVCKVALGVGALNVYPGIVESPRYADAVIRIQFTDGVPFDIAVSGPLDRGGSYAVSGKKVSGVAVGDGWFIDAVGSSVREHLVIDSSGRLLWSSVSYAVEFKAAAVALYTGQCEAL